MHTATTSHPFTARRASVRAPVTPSKSQRLRCPNCRTRRTDPHSMFLHLVHCKQEDCTCGGYHYKHRRGSPLCEANPLSPLRLAKLHGVTRSELLDVHADVAFTARGERWRPGEPIPL